LNGVLLRVAYDGTDFHGWAPQAGLRTVSGVLSAAIANMSSDASPLRGCSRTDAGVHALDQVVAFDCTQNIPSKGWLLGINQHLPDDVAVRSAAQVEPNFEPRFRNVQKRYAYHVRCDRVRDPFSRNTAWRVDHPVDVDKIRSEARAFVGAHTFGAFHSARDERTSFEREVLSVDVDWTAPNLVIRVSGKAFLYNMVRIMVGTLIDIGRGHLPEGTVRSALLSQKRKDAGMTAPAHGLVLEHIELPDVERERWP
jgi:tRNA pseudouridine38-40 synthase